MINSTTSAIECESSSKIDKHKHHFDLSIVKWCILSGLCFYPRIQAKYKHLILTYYRRLILLAYYLLSSEIRDWFAKTTNNINGKKSNLYDNIFFLNTFFLLYLWSWSDGYCVKQEQRQLGTSTKTNGHCIIDQQDRAQDRIKFNTS